VRAGQFAACFENGYSNQTNFLETTSVIAACFQKDFLIKQLCFHNNFAPEEHQGFRTKFSNSTNINFCKTKENVWYSHNINMKTEKQC